MKIAWKEYQKDIADDNYFYARSCIRQNFFPGSEAAFLNILRQDLGRDVYEDPRHTSCTGIGYHSDIVPLETIMTVVARQFSLMTEAGYENFVPSCITSFGIYSEALELWHDFPELEDGYRPTGVTVYGIGFTSGQDHVFIEEIVFAVVDTRDTGDGESRRNYFGDLYVNLEKTDRVYVSVNGGYGDREAVPHVNYSDKDETGFRMGVLPDRWCWEDETLDVSGTYEF